MHIAHADHRVDIVGESGNVTGQKLRREIDKTRDLYHSVYVLLITPQHELVLSQIPARQDLPNLYAGQLGITVATIRRHGETAAEAAQRALFAEIGLPPKRTQTLHELGTELATLPDGRKAFMTSYYLIHKQPDSHSTTDIAGFQLFTIAKLKEKMASATNQLSPTLQYIWQKYKTRAAFKQ